MENQIEERVENEMEHLDDLKGLSGLRIQASFLGGPYKDDRILGCLT